MRAPSDLGAAAARTAPAGEFPPPKAEPAPVRAVEGRAEAAREDGRESFLLVLLRALSVWHT